MTTLEPTALDPADGLGLDLEHEGLAITGSGIEVGTRVNIPDELIPEDARVEMTAKMAAGYFTPGAVPGADDLKSAKGRGLDA